MKSKTRASDVAAAATMRRKTRALAKRAHTHALRKLADPQIGESAISRERRALVHARCTALRPDAQCLFREIVVQGGLLADHMKRELARADFIDVHHETVLKELTDQNLVRHDSEGRYYVAGELVPYAVEYVNRVLAVRREISEAS
jgi:hypothetical protein